jgi:hypothetical protein
MLQEKCPLGKFSVDEFSSVAKCPWGELSGLRFTLLINPEYEFLNIYKGLKSRLFKGQRVQQGSNWLMVLGVNWK